MADEPTSHDRMRRGPTDDAAVTVTATGLALVAFVGVSVGDTGLGVPSEFAARFLLSLSLLTVSFLYDDHWPVAYEPAFAVAWTVLAGLLSVALFLGVYGLVGVQFGTTAASVAAFLTTVGTGVGTARLYGRLR
jgi:hypothetical protein